MWKWLHQLARPERLYHVCGRFIPAGAGGGGLPAAWLGMGLWFRAEGLSARRQLPHHLYSRAGGHVVDGYLRLDGGGGVYRPVWQMKMSDTVVAAMAPIGAVFTFIALVTGSARASRCGARWVWDARLTSELVLLFLYMGVIALYNAFEDRRLAGRAAGILVLVGVVNIPIIHFRSNGGIRCIRARPICSSLSRQACAPAALGDPRLPAAVRHADADAPAQSDPVRSASARGSPGW